VQQTLFRIPLDAPWSLGPLGEVPGFGFGLALVLWVLVGGFWCYRMRKELELSPALLLPAAFWIVGAIIIVRVPSFIHRDAHSVIEGATAAIARGDAPTPAYMARGHAYQTIHDDVRAAADYKAASDRDAKAVEPRRELAWLLSTSPNDAVRDPKAAADVAIEMSRLAGDRDPWALDVLAATLTETGKFDEAITTARRSAELADDSLDPVIANRLRAIRERLALYQEHRPWREPRVGKAIPIYGYGFMLFLGFFAAGWTGTRRAASAGIPADLVWDIALWLFFAGIAGCRLFYILEYPDRVFGGKQGMEKLIAIVNLPDGGLVLYGGVISGIIVYILYCRKKGLNAQKIADALVPSLFLGVAFGRIGCFLNGCCYGDRCELPWAVTFPVGSVPDMALVTRGYLAAEEVVNRISLHPTQIYSAIDGFILYLLTAGYFRMRPKPGAVTIVSLLCYPVTRFFIEYLRSDEPPVLVHVRTLIFRGSELFQVQTPFTISQWVSVGMFAGGVAYWWWWSRKPAATAAAVPPELLATPSAT
jgi:phosphatidylglycerol:prolipoprotein diacylglycerol transferase